MAEQYPHDQPDARQPDVVVFSPELLKMADAHRQRRQYLEECRQAADSGDCAAAVQMGVSYLYGTGGVQKDPEQAFYWFSQSAPDDPVGLYWQAVCYDSGAGGGGRREEGIFPFSGERRDGLCPRHMRPGRVLRKRPGHGKGHG